MLHASLQRNVCSGCPTWCRPEDSEYLALFSVHCHQRQDTPGQWTLWLLLPWRWYGAEHHRRSRLIRQKAFREDPDWCWRGELQTGNQVCPHQGIYPDKVKGCVRKLDSTMKSRIWVYPVMIIIALVCLWMHCVSCPHRAQLHWWCCCDDTVALLGWVKRAPGEDITKLLTPEQFGPGFVSTSCISLVDTSAVLAEKLNNVRIAVAAMRTTAGLACCVRQFSSFMALKMDMTLSAHWSFELNLSALSLHRYDIDKDEGFTFNEATYPRTSAALVEKLSEVRIAVPAIRTTAGLLTACCFWQFLSFRALKMDTDPQTFQLNWSEIWRGHVFHLFY